MSEPDAENNPTPDRITSMRRVFAAEAERAKANGERPSPHLYMQTQMAILLCDILEAQQQTGTVIEALAEELREVRLSAPLRK